MSEFMLQQTRVETAIPYYRRFLAKFPDIWTLADASEEEVLSAWQGLGYYSRARNLQLAARECAARYGGRVPDSPAEIAALPGVGPYIAGAVLSIAYGRARPAVDGNVMRVFSRFLGSDEPIDRPAARRAVEDAVRRSIPADRPGDFNQAVMELGATICLPRAPRCLACPAARFCAAFQAGLADRLPVRGPRRAPRDVRLAVALARADGRVLIARRPPGGLLGGLWEFPNVELQAEEESGPAIERMLADRWGLVAVAGPPVLSYEHAFTHLRWRARVHAIDVHDAGAPTSAAAGGIESRWASPAELADYPFGNAFRPVLELAYPVARRCTSR